MRLEIARVHLFDKISFMKVLTEKNKKEDIADNFVIMKVKKNEFIKNL